MDKEELIKAIERVPEFMVFGNWDYKRCIFCWLRGNEEHKGDCIRVKIKDYRAQLKMEL